MSQNWYTDVYQPSTKSAHDVMSQIELMLETLKSGFAGAAYASDPVGGMACHRPNGRRIRNYANTAWLASLMGDANQKMYVYRNDTCQGWVIDTSVTDVVLAIRGGSQAYNVNGGNLAGAWSHNHATAGHALTIGEMPPHAHTYSRTSVGDANGYSSSDSANRPYLTTVSTSSVGGGAEHDHGNVTSNTTFRPRAAVGTLQYPDLS